jgi:hypothetical protein
LLLGWRPALVDASPILSAPTVAQNVGDTFSIAISVTDAVGLTSFQFDLGFDATIVKVLSFSDVGTDFEAAATAGGGFLTGLTGFGLGSPTNVLSGVADSISGLGNGLTPGGSLVFIQFEALAPGVTPLTFSCALCQGGFLTDNGLPLFSAIGDFSLQDGQISVLQPAAAIPEPATVILLSTGLAAAALRRRKPRTRTF